MTYAIDFAPHLPMFYVWLAAAATVLLGLFAIVVRARGALVRFIAFALLVAALANPLIVRETREPLPDIVALIVDHTPSMEIRGRMGEADKAAAQLRAMLAKDKSITIREATVTAPRGE